MALLQHCSVSTGAYRTDCKVLIGISLEATIKTVCLEKEGKTMEQEKRERQSSFVSGRRGRKGQARRKSCRHDEQEKVLTNIKFLPPWKLMNETC